MQNRRLFRDDWRGVEEALNEMDAYWNGITVPATYRLQLLERDQDFSYQRTMQMLIDEPIQLFFSFNYTMNQSESFKTLKDRRMEFVKAHNANLPPAFKHEVFPMGQNNIFLRVENIGDKFDTDYRNLTSNDTSITVDLYGWAEALFNASNSQ